MIRGHAEHAPHAEPVERPLRYLVSTSGHPNVGDELITRAWLDFLAEAEPESDVWLDCIQPGRASHLFVDTHPRLRTTNTLWEAALGFHSGDMHAAEDRVHGLVRDLGSPKFDEGLLLARHATSIHILGGGYLNSIWPDNLGLIAAATAYREHFGIPVFLTGAGLMPQEPASAEWLTERFAAFEHTEARDEPSARATGIALGHDDAFLALALPRPLFSSGIEPERMVLVQGDLQAWDDAHATALIDGFIAGTDDIGFVEAVPPEDHRYMEGRHGDVGFYPFGRLWHDGLPMRAGQSWLTSRYHFHLLGAAVGAAGVVITGQPGYYDVKHRSLLDLGTGWNVVAPGELAGADEARVDPGFTQRAVQIAEQKLAAARRMYGVA